MKRLLAFLLLLAAPAEASDSLSDAFAAYVQMKKIEGNLEVNARNTRLDEADREIRHRELSAALTESRIHFHSVARSDGAELASWEKALLAAVAKGQPVPKAGPQALEFLQAKFKSPKSLTALEWQAMQDFFGRKAQEDFLRSAFGVNELPKNVSASAPDKKILWILDPFRRLTRSESVEKKDLAKFGKNVEPIEVSLFATVESQAEELRQALLSREEPFVIVSSGEASAVVNKVFDLYPALRAHPTITGWINVNGRLFGRAPAPLAKNLKTGNGRAIASLATSGSSVDRVEADAMLGLNLLRLEALDRQAPLGEGFPIVNLVSLEEKFRPASNLRESLVADGTTWYLLNGAGWKHALEVLPLLKR